MNDSKVAFLYCDCLYILLDLTPGGSDDILFHLFLVSTNK